MRIKTILFILLSSIVVCLAAPYGNRSPFSKRENLARGKECVFGFSRGWTPPRNRTTKLCDGVYANPSVTFWSQPEEVIGGEMPNRRVCFVTIDLGSDQPISGASVSLSTAPFGNTTTKLIYVNVSTDNVVFHHAGELVACHPYDASHYRTGISARIYRNGDFKTHGRYVRFLFCGASSLYMDEIEVYKGDEAWRNIAYDGPDYKGNECACTPEALTEICAKTRMYWMDQLLRKELDSPAIKRHADFGALQKEADDIFAQIANYRFTGDIAKFTTEPPFCTLNQRQFDLLSRIRRAEGFSPCTVWSCYRYDPMPMNVKPRIEAENMGISLHLAGNDLRAGTFNVTNFSGKNMPFRFSVDISVPHTVFSIVQYDDFKSYFDVLDALYRLSPENGVYHAEAANGLSRQIWIEFNTKGVKPGLHFGKITVETPFGVHAIPLSIKVAKRALPETPQMLGWGWEYMSVGHYYDIVDANRKATVDNMRENLFSMTIGHMHIAQLPFKKGSADKDGHLKVKVDFSQMEEWMRQYPDARRYCLVPGGDIRALAGFAWDTPQFETALGEWAEQWEEWLEAHDMPAGKVMYNILDEPNTEERVAWHLKWMQIIRAKAPRIGFYINPNRPMPCTELDKEFLHFADSIDTFVLPLRVYDHPQTIEFIKKSIKPGVRLGVAGASEPHDLGPAYFRRLPSITYTPNMFGCGYFCYSLTGSPDRRNDYAYIGGYSTSPVIFTADNQVISTKMVRAFADSIRDIDTYALLKDQKLAERLAHEAGNAIRGTDRNGGMDPYPKSRLRVIDDTLSHILDIADME